MNKTSPNGLCEWDEQEIKIFLQEITRYTLPLEKRMEAIRLKNEHKKMIDLLVFYQFYEHIGRISLNCTPSNWSAFKQLVNEKKLKVSTNQNDFFQPPQLPQPKPEVKQEQTEQQNNSQQTQQNNQTQKTTQNDQSTQQQTQDMYLNSNVEFRITTNFRILICHFRQHNETDYTFTMSYPQLVDNYNTTVAVLSQPIDQTEMQTVHFYNQLFETCLKVELQENSELFYNFICQNGKLVTNYFFRQNQ